MIDLNLKGAPELWLRRHERGRPPYYDRVVAPTCRPPERRRRVQSALIEDVRRYLEHWGATAVVIPGTRDGAVNLYAVVGPVGERGVLLSGHSDVVPASSEDWASDPFELSRRGQKLFGRGSCDMKGFLAAVLASVPELTEMALPRPIALAISADEEMGVRGSGRCLTCSARTDTRPLFCVVGEPTRMRVAVAHKGKVALRANIRGRAAHASSPQLGASAIAHAAALITQLYEYGQQLAREKRDDRFAVPHPSVNVGTVVGGTSMNVVADRCALEVEYRLLPGQSPEDVVSAVRLLVEREEAEMRGASEAAIALEVIAAYPGLDMTGAVPALVAGLAETDCTMCADFGTEAGLFHERLGVPVVICGPGDVAQAHTADEFIDVTNSGDANSSYAGWRVGFIRRDR